MTTSEAIEIRNYGGIDFSGDFYLIPENTSLLESGQYYILTAYAQPDGSLLVSGENSSTQVDFEIPKFIDKIFRYSDMYKDVVLKDKKISKYTEAYENEILFNRTRYVSIYDESINN